MVVCRYWDRQIMVSLPCNVMAIYNGLSRLLALTFCADHRIRLANQGFGPRLSARLALAAWAYPPLRSAAA
jgi:hypothetical protein